MSIIILAAQVLFCIIAAIFVLFVYEGWLAWKRWIAFEDMQDELRLRDLEDRVRRSQQ